MKQPGFRATVARVRSTVWLCLVGCLSWNCAGVPLYPARPSPSSGAAISDPLPAKLVVHVSATAEGLKNALDTQVPAGGEASFELRGTRQVTWSRGPFTLRFADGRVSLKTELSLKTDLPLLGQVTVPLQVSVVGEPVITPDWKARLQGATVLLESKDFRLRTAEGLAGALKTANGELEKYIENFSYDLTPQISAAYQRVALPIDLSYGEAHGCATLKVASIEAGPTVLAGAFEKDLAIVVAPSVSFPCSVGELSPTPPPLANVATLPSGPFTVTVPIAARYEELARAMSLTFTDGKLFFSKDFPKLYMEKPELYASTSDQLVLKLHLAGPISAAGLNATLDGDLYFAGHPQIIDNELRLPDLEPTIETSSFLLALKANLDGKGIRDQARAALKLDLTERLQSVRAKLSSDVAFGGSLGCLRADVAKIEVTGVYPHSAYLRVYVTVTAQASALLPCPTPAVSSRASN